MRNLSKFRELIDIAAIEMGVRKWVEESAPDVSSAAVTVVDHPPGVVAVYMDRTLGPNVPGNAARESCVAAFKESHLKGMSTRDIIDVVTRRVKAAMGRWRRVKLFEADLTSDDSEVALSLSE